MNKLIALTLALAVGGGANLTHAAINVGVDPSKFGLVNQLDVTPTSGGSGGQSSCAPTAMANAFTFLQNQYSSVYGTSLVNSASYNDIKSTAITLTSPTYMNTTVPAGTSGANWVAGMVNYLNAVAPGKTTFSGMGDVGGISVFTFPWYTNSRVTFSFLQTALSNGSAVELGLINNAQTVGHALSLTSLHIDDANNNGLIEQGEASISYIDPATGAAGTCAVWQPFTGSQINVDYAHPGVSTGTINLATAETPIPVPEPASLLLLTVPFLALRGSARPRRIV